MQFKPPLQSAEWHQLQTNILSEGCRQALLVWKTYSDMISETASEALVEVNILIDGHNRYEICLQHGLDFPVQFIDFDSLQMAKNYMIEYCIKNEPLQALSVGSSSILVKAYFSFKFLNSPLISKWVYD
jgi:hypothetical protein